MQDYYESIASRRKGSQWTSQIIQQIWTRFYLPQWHLKNKFVHNKTESTKQTRKREDLQARMVNAYESATKQDMLVKDQHLYNDSLQTLLKTTNDSMISWMTEFNLAQRDRLEAYQSDRENSTRTLQSWMVPQRLAASQPLPHPPPRKRLRTGDNDRRWGTTGTIEELRRGSWQPL